MRNYMKSEWYRIIHTKDIYAFTGIMSGMTLLFNLIHYICNQKIAGFRYGTVSFSLSFLVSGMPILMVAGAVLAGLLFSGEKKNGILKNAVAFGISREKIFVGKSLICSIMAFFCMVIILAVYIGSACLLLEGPAEEAVRQLLKGTAAVLLCAVAAVILANLLLTRLEKDVMAVVWWLIIMLGIPQVCFFAGLKIELLSRIAEWMPWNYLENEVVVSLSGGWQCLWDTPEGMAKCLISGALGLLIFLISGILFCRKQEM